MPHRRTTFSKFIIEEAVRGGVADASLTGLLNDIQTACKFVALAVSRGTLDPAIGTGTQTPSEIVSNECARGGALRAIAMPGTAEPFVIPVEESQGPYLLVVDPLDGSTNLDVNVTVGTIFSILRAPGASEAVVAADFLQAGSRQVAAGFALYGPCSTIVLTLGRGVHGFTLDREIGAYTLTHPDMRIAERTHEFAIDASNERFWEPPVRHYVRECVSGKAGPREDDFSMRWVASLVTDVYRILVRGGLYVHSHDSRDPSELEHLRLLHEVAPMAMVVEQAGGLASTGRERILDLVPSSLDQRVPVVLGSRSEVERLVGYHAAYDRGEDLAFDSPLFSSRSMFRSNRG